MLDGEKAVYVSQPRTEDDAKAWREELEQNSRPGITVTIVSLGEGELYREQIKQREKDG